MNDKENFDQTIEKLKMKIIDFCKGKTEEETKNSYKEFMEKLKEKEEEND